MATTSTQTDRRRRGVSPPLSADGWAVVAAVVSALVAWGSARVADVELAVERGGDVQEIGGVAVAVVAGVSALVGLAFLRLLERRTSKALPVWIGSAVSVTLVSLLGPLGATTAAGTGALLTLHGVVAGVVIAAAVASRRHRRAP
jgi:Family of unknown function (DUF6069)